MIKGISCGDLVDTGLYRKHSQFSKAINYCRVDQTCESLLSVVLPEVGGGPYNIVVKDFNFLTNEFLEINSKVLQFHRYDSRLPSSNLSQNIKIDLIKKILVEKYFERSKISFLLKASLAESQSSFDKAFEAHFKKGVDLLFSNSVQDGVKMLRGTGVGLTPTGDDYLCGVMIGLHFTNLNHIQSMFNVDKLASDIYATAIGENLISNSALFAAKSARVSESIKFFLLALLKGSVESIEESLDVVARIGHSSGVDILIGLVMAL